jgi:hypothetical protein
MLIISPRLKGARVVATTTTTTTTRNGLRRGQRDIVGMQDRLTFTGNSGPPVFFVESVLATSVVGLVVAGMKAACVASESAMMPRNLIENFIVRSLPGDKTA